MPVVVTPITSNFGAEICGANLTRPLDEATRRDLIDAQEPVGRHRPSQHRPLSTAPGEQPS